MAGIYVHVPFCNAKCSYCDFYSIANHGLLPLFTDAVRSEWQERRHELGDHVVETVYFGGGTPSVLPPADIATIASLFPLDAVKEFTIEVNPEGVTPQTASAWRAAGVNRVSIGVQSLVDAELVRVGRRHTASRALEAIATLHAAGINNVSGDLIYGLPGQTASSWRKSLEGLLGADITHLSAYCLGYEPGTRLYMQREREEVTEATDDLIAEMYGILCDTMASAGFGHYEISNFALPGLRSRHNSSYWSGNPYLGLGPGAHSLGADGMRRFVASDVRRYIADPSACLEEDPESDTDRVNDRIMVSLRTAAGLDLGAFTADVRKAIEEGAATWLRSGVLQRRGDALVVPEESWLLCDAVIRDMFV